HVPPEGEGSGDYRTFDAEARQRVVRDLRRPRRLPLPLRHLDPAQLAGGDDPQSPALHQEPARPPGREQVDAGAGPSVRILQGAGGGAGAHPVRASTLARDSGSRPAPGVLVPTRSCTAPNPSRIRRVSLKPASRKIPTS